MAAPALTGGLLPPEAQLRSFARAAGHLLTERQPRASGSRTVSRRPGVGIQHHDHRDYVAGDDVRHIDWRLTARHRQPLIRRFESESVSDWTIVLDASSSMLAHGGGRWQAAVQAAAAMSYAPLQLGHRVGLLVFGTRVLAQVPRGRGQHQYAAIAARLASLRPLGRGERSELAACAPHVGGLASVFIISDFLADDEMRRDLASLAQRCTALHALQLASLADVNLPPLGEVELVDVETGASRPARVDAAAGTAAAEERAAMKQRLRGMCRLRGIAFTEWDVAEPWQRVLVRHLLQAQANC